MGISQLYSHGTMITGPEIAADQWGIHESLDPPSVGVQFPKCSFHYLKILRYSSQASQLLQVFTDSICVADCSLLTLSSSLFLWEDPQETETSTVEIRGQQNLSSTGIEESAPCCDGYESWPNVDTGITCGPALFISWVCYVKWG